MTATEILKSILSFLTDYDTAIGSFIYDLVRPVSEEMAKVYTNNKDTLQKAFALTANGIYLDFKVAEQGITRKQAEYAKGVVTITGIKGAVIRAGSKVASGDLMFSILEDAVLPESGMIDVSAVCDTAGNVGNVATNSITRFPVKLSGLIDNKSIGDEGDETVYVWAMLDYKTQKVHVGLNVIQNSNAENITMHASGHAKFKIFNVVK